MSKLGKTAAALCLAIAFASPARGQLLAPAAPPPSPALPFPTKLHVLQPSSRGPESGDITLCLLAPTASPGTTGRSEPTLLFFVFGTHISKVKFALLSHNSTRAHVEFEIPGVVSGRLHAIRFSELRARLCPWVTYTWSVAVFGVPLGPVTEPAIGKAILEYHPAPPADARPWYDAVASAVETVQAGTGAAACPSFDGAGADLSDQAAYPRGSLPAVDVHPGSLMRFDDGTDCTPGQ